MSQKNSIRLLQLTSHTPASNIPRLPLHTSHNPLHCYWKLHIHFILAAFWNSHVVFLSLVKRYLIYNGRKMLFPRMSKQETKWRVQLFIGYWKSKWEVKSLGRNFYCLKLIWLLSSIFQIRLPKNAVVNKTRKHKHVESMTSPSTWPTGALWKHYCVINLTIQCVSPAYWKEIYNATGNITL